ncbi:MAG TPA: HAMP domain-containing sensor histidine kinase [Streptosporangiaceae bacterium]|nr:HAMP domain-containing sensor histidine kinase [Streptosporangiaceae bacterium]
MKGPRGWSLRTRLLLLQLAVTAVLLLVLGIVSTDLFAHNLTGQFNLGILDESTRSPSDIRQRPAPQLSAVLVTFSPFSVVPLPTGRAAVGHALADAIRQLGQPKVYQRARRDDPFLVGPVHGTDYHLTAVARVIPATENFSRSVRSVSVLVVAEQQSGLTSQVRGLIAAEIITGGGLLALLALGGRWLVGRGLEPLDRMAKTANDITTRGDLTERMAGPDDETEVGRLRAAINTMLDRIQQAFGARLSSERKVREFAADASHELRTPLTTIRGYAELYRQGALGPDQLPGAMRRIEQEAQRMSTLVAELLELARLDRTSSLDLTETDLATVVRDAVADATAVEPDRPISAQAPPRLIAVVDERRIRQVLSNLLGNVRAHTPRSAPVAVRLGRVQGGVLIEVADSGPGMSEKDAARAFDRFHRATERPGMATESVATAASVTAATAASATAAAGDSCGPAGSTGSPAGSLGSAKASCNGSSSGNGGLTSSNGGSAKPMADFSAGGGSGLGLSIVQAIASAHGGQATLESWLGHGTRVRIWLPSRAATPAAL